MASENLRECSAVIYAHTILLRQISSFWPLWRIANGLWMRGITLVRLIPSYGAVGPQRIHSIPQRNRTGQRNGTRIRDTSQKYALERHGKLWRIVQNSWRHCGRRAADGKEDDARGRIYASGKTQQRMAESCSSGAPRGMPDAREQIYSERFRRRYTTWALMRWFTLPLLTARAWRTSIGIREVKWESSSWAENHAVVGGMYT